MAFVAGDFVSLGTLQDNVDRTSYTLTLSRALGANKLGLIAVASRITAGGAADPTSITGGGVTWVKINGTNVGGITTVSLWRAMGGSPSGTSITIDFNGVTQDHCQAHAVEVSNVDTTGTNGSGAIAQSAINSSAGATSLTVTLGAVGANNATLGAFSVGANEATAPGSGFTELSDRNGGSTNLGSEVEYQIGTDNTVDIGVGATSRRCGVAVELVFSSGSTNASFTATKRSFSLTQKDPVVHGSASFTSTKRTYSITIKDPTAQPKQSFTSTKRTFSITVKDPVIHGSTSFTSTKRAYSITVKDPVIHGSASFTGTKRAYSISLKAATTRGSAAFTSTKRTFSLTVKDPVVHTSASFTSTKRTFALTQKAATGSAAGVGNSFTATKRTFTLTQKDPVVHTSAGFTTTKRTFSFSVKASRTVRTSTSFTSTKRAYSIAVKSAIVHGSAGFTATKRAYTLTVKSPTPSGVTSTSTYVWIKPIHFGITLIKPGRYYTQITDGGNRRVRYRDRKHL